MARHRVELLVAGRGLRFAGWLVDVVALGLLGLALRLVGVTGWTRVLAFDVLVALDAIVLVAWAGGNVGNLVIGTQVVVAGDASRTGVGRAALRWAVIQGPIILAFLGGAWWFATIWAIVVYGPILFTRLRQGLHDRVAGVLVIRSRHYPEGWALANGFFARVRR